MVVPLWFAEEVCMKIQTLLEMKGRDVVTVHPTAKLSTVVRRMKLGRIGCVVVSEDGRGVQGIVAVRDISYALAENDDAKFVMDLTASEIMTHSVRTCTPEDTLKSVMQDMTHWHILNTPVLKDKILHGIVNIDDVVKYAVEEMELESEILHEDVIRLQTLKSLS
jgi:CBS domain-containing protein